MENDNERMSIYRVSRTIKRRENTLFNALRSIYEDSIFVGEISELWPQLPLVANLRCGFWYSSNFYSTCYFKSTDGHNNNWSFSTSRLNLHIALLAGQKGGCIIVDSTRKGKRFPDSMSKTIPIWLCLLNRALRIIKSRESLLTCDWDCSLHLPPWISKTEEGAIEHRLDGWFKQFEASGADIASIALLLRKPLRPLWISQRSLIWLNEVPDYDSWDFTPIILVSASCSNDIVQHRTTSEFSWSYIPGAGDDEESWARGLTPTLFWKHAIDVINFGPGLCNQRVADIVEMDRVCRAHRGQNGSQVSARSSKCVNCKPSMNLRFTSLKGDVQVLYDEEHPISWLGSTNLAVGKTQNGIEAGQQV